MLKKVLSLILTSLLVAVCVVVFYLPANSVSTSNNFVDTFSGGAGNWKPIMGNWTCEGDEYSQDNMGAGANLTVLKDKRWGDATYELDLKVVDNGGSSANWAGLQFKKMLIDDNPFDSGFMVYVKANGVMELYKVNKILASASTGLSFTTFRHLKVVTSGENIKVYINHESTPRINVNDPTFASGYVGLVAFNSHWHFDNVKVSGPDLPYTINVGSSQLLYDNAHMDAAPIQMHLDQSFVTMKRDATNLDVYMVNSYDPDLIKMHGPIDNPLQTKDWVKADSSYIDKNGYGSYYTNGYEIWIPNMYKVGTNELIGITHNEAYSPTNPRGTDHPDFSLGIAYSNDNGSTWEYCGEFLWPKHRQLNVGGTPYVIVGSYIYVYYNEGTQKEGTSPWPRSVSIARANLQEVINAARLHQTSTWHKYVNGSFTGNAFTGVGTAIIDNTFGQIDTHADAAYCSAIGKYLLTIQTEYKSKLLLYSSTDGVNYSMEAVLDNAPGQVGGVMQPYSAFLDLDGASDDSSTVDGDFYIMYPRKGGGSGNYSYDDVYRRRITITTNTGDKYSALSGFSSTQGANQWYYKQWNGSTYSNMTWDSTNNRWRGGQTYSIVGSSWQHPDVNDSVRVWKAPKSGTVRVSGVARKAESANGGDGVRVKILKGTTQVWPASGWQSIAYNNFTGFSHDNLVTVAAGDEIYFIVNKNSTNTNDTTYWNPNVDYIDTTRNEYNSSEGFSLKQGDDQWYYKQWNGSTYSDMTTWSSGENRWNGQTYCIVASDWQHPDINDSVRAWKAPKAGTITITGKVRKGLSANTSGDGVNVKILRNSTQLWPTSGWQFIAYNNTTGVTHSVTISVAQGDMIYFILNRNGNITNDQTDWDATIIYN